MTKTINQRMAAELDRDGMRINRSWKVHKWLPVFRTMVRMLGELHRKPESGFLGFESYGMCE